MVHKLSALPLTYFCSFFRLIIGYDPVLCSSLLSHIFFVIYFGCYSVWALAMVLSSPLPHLCNFFYLFFRLVISYGPLFFHICAISCICSSSWSWLWSSTFFSRICAISSVCSPIWSLAMVESNRVFFSSQYHF